VLACRPGQWRRALGDVHRPGRLPRGVTSGDIHGRLSALGARTAGSDQLGGRCG
jgi:hypothetical protein